MDVQYVAVVASGVSVPTVVLGLIVMLSHRAMVAQLTAGFRGVAVGVKLQTNGGGGSGVGPVVRGGVPARNYGPLSWLPAWGQTSGVLPDGSADPQEYNDCGETCCAMIIAAVHGTPVEPGEIRQYLAGPAGSGLTTAGDLVHALGHWSVQAVQASVAASQGLANVRTQVMLGFPTIILGNWLSMASLHWMLVAGIAAQGVTVIDPWTGQRRVLASGDFLARFAGSMVVAQAHCHYDMAGRPAPGVAGGGGGDKPAA